MALPLSVFNRASQGVSRLKGCLLFAKCLHGNKIYAPFKRGERLLGKLWVSHENGSQLMKGNQNWLV